ncbi:MAG: biotin/lipoyl-binding protein [Gammaproteobacteria bacterium]|nr:MAG: biotin/lipoyl-binding protein [Gammaproteobacteria bacterium]
MKLQRLLIANRGEIACRVIRSCRRLGVRTIAVYSEADRGARHVREADEAWPIGPSPARESYLDIGRILDTARAARADAIHPGYGFLSENADFAAACASAGMVFIGPPPAAIRAMGLKHEAKALVAAAGVPVVPGYAGEEQSAARLLTEARSIGFPLLVKAVAGGGGRGMRVVRAQEELADAITAARAEAESAFGDGRLLLERFLEQPRHIEVQVFGDQHGGCVHLFERECSVQRRYQKIIEESPSPFIDAATRAAMTAAAVRAARAVDYVNAGTIEFIVAADGSFCFMEMNTRLQVEHPVTEAITGIDLVEWQLAVADGAPLPLAQEQIRQQGHAFEARICSEDPARGFLPSTGVVERFIAPEPDASWRIDRGVDDGDAVSVWYDALVAKVIATGVDRASALATLRHRLNRTALHGVTTNLALLRRILAHPDFAAGGVDTGFVDRELAKLVRPAHPDPRAVLLAARVAVDGIETAARGSDRLSPWSRGDAWRMAAPAVHSLGLQLPAFQRVRARCQDDRIEVAMDGEALAGRVRSDGRQFVVEMGPESRGFELIRHGTRLQIIGDQADEITLAPAWPFERSVDDAEAHPSSPLPGRVVALHVATGDLVEAGQILAVVEGMKVQHSIRAARPGRITSVRVAQGDLVDAEALLLELTPT